MMGDTEFFYEVEESHHFSCFSTFTGDSNGGIYIYSTNGGNALKAYIESLTMVNLVGSIMNINLYSTGSQLEMINRYVKAREALHIFRARNSVGRKSAKNSH